MQSLSFLKCLPLPLLTRVATARTSIRKIGSLNLLLLTPTVYSTTNPFIVEYTVGVRSRRFKLPIFRIEVLAVATRVRSGKGRHFRKLKDCILVLQVSKHPV